MSHQINKHLFDIRQAIEDIESFLNDKKYHDFTSGTLIQSAVERKLEIIGEALNRIKKKIARILDNITDAHRIIAFRNVLIHGYDNLDSKIIWDVCHYNLSKLKEEINNLMDN